MSLYVECENGHKLACPESLSGSSVICPKCGIRVDVSARNIVRGGRKVTEAAITSISGISKQVATKGDAVARPLAGPKADEIAFRCPNGHRLNGPRSLQGQQGECPKCKIKFRVPVIDWHVSGDDQAGGTASAAPPMGQATQDTAVGLPTPTEEDDDISLDGIEELEQSSALTCGAAEQAAGPSSPAGGASSTHPLEQLLIQLWRERAHGGVVELHLDNGAILTPDWWAAGRSTDSYGLFAVQTAEGSYEIHAVVWAHVRQISVRQLGELPGGVFEGT